MEKRRGDSLEYKGDGMGSELDGHEQLSAEIEIFGRSGQERDTGGALRMAVCSGKCRWVSGVFEVASAGDVGGCSVRQVLMGVVPSWVFDQQAPGMLGVLDAGERGASQPAALAGC